MEGPTFSVRDFYDGKTIFVTGATGFVGKVILEKLLRCTPDVKHIYVLIRPKGGTTPTERMRKELFDSPVFDRLRGEVGQEEFANRFNSKMRAVGGDLQHDHLIFDEKERKMIADTVQIYLSCAASIDFMEKLDMALQFNCLGPLRLLEIAKSGSACERFLHVSTAYVNSDKRGHIPDVISPLRFDAESIIEKIQSASPNELAELTARLSDTYGFPNTYTYTKAIAETLLAKRCGSLPLRIVRPSCVEASYREPSPGWIDAISATAAMAFAAGTGLITLSSGDSNAIGDRIPVDYVVNVILAAAAQPVETTQRVTVYHIASSEQNPVTWGETREHILSYWSRHRAPRARRYPPVASVHSRQMFNIQFFFRYKLPAEIVVAILRTFFRHSERLQRKARRLKTGVERSRLFSDTFEFFLSHEWIFSMRNTRSLMSRINTSERDIFFCDVESIDWQQAMDQMSFGLQRLVSRNAAVTSPPPHHVHLQIPQRRLAGIRDLLRGQPLRDIWWIKTRSPPQIVDTRDLAERALSHPMVTKAIADAKDEDKARAEARKIARRVAATPQHRSIEAMAYILRKIFQVLYRDMSVDAEGLSQLRNTLETKPETRIVLVPTHRSYADFLIVSYVLYALRVRMPHIAAGEDFLHIAVMHHVLRQCGAFFLRRSFGGDGIYRAVFSAYVDILLAENHMLEFFIEGTRSRSGRMLQPRAGMVSFLVEAVQRRPSENLVIVPMSINYDRLLEEKMYPAEMLGETKRRESLKNLVSASRILRHSFGQVHVNFGEHIDVNEFVSSHGGNRRAVVSDLSWRIVHGVARSVRIVPTAIVASSVLRARQGIPKRNVLQEFSWICDELSKSGAQVIHLTNESDAVDTALKLLRDGVSVKRGNMVVPKSSTESYTPLLLLSFYRNQLLDVFKEFSVVSVALLSFGSVSEQGILADRLCDEIALTNSWFARDVVGRRAIAFDLKDECLDVLADMSNRGILSIRESNGQREVFIGKGQHRPLEYFASLLWPNAEAMWVASVALVALVGDGVSVKKDELSKHMQHTGINLYEDGSLALYEACSINLMRSSIESLIENGVLTILEDQTTVALASDHASETAVMALSDLFTRFGCTRPVSAMQANDAWKYTKSLRQHIVPDLAPAKASRSTRVAARL